MIHIITGVRFVSSIIYALSRQPYVRYEKFNKDTTMVIKRRKRNKTMIKSTNDDLIRV